MTILLMYKETKSFELVKDYLSRSGNVNILEAETVDIALQTVKETNVDLVIVDEQLGAMSGIQFINTLVKVNPFINTALVSSLPPDDFHEETEGLGVLMQLPIEPQKTDVEELLQKMEKIASLMLSPPGKEVSA